MRIFGMGIQEILVIVLICLLIFGASKLPEIGRAMGKAIREFRKSANEKGNSGGDDERKSQDPRS